MLAPTLFFSVCSGQRTTLSGLQPERFDSIIDGKATKLITIGNNKGMEVCLTNYGGRVVSIVVPDKDGRPTDVACAYDNLHQYADTLNSPSDYGASVGRYANRIKDAKTTPTACTAEETQVGKTGCTTSLRKQTPRLFSPSPRQMATTASPER